MNSCRVYIAYSTCANVDTFVLSFSLYFFFFFFNCGHETFWSWLWIPKDGECFFLYDVFTIAEFPVIKEGFTRWGNVIYFSLQSGFLPQMFSRRIWMLCLFLPLSFHASRLPPVWPHLPAHLPACLPARQPWTVLPSLHSISFTRSCITSSLPRVFCRMPSLCSQTLSDTTPPQKTKNKKRKCESLTFRRAFDASASMKVLLLALPATSVLSLF